MRFDQDGNYIVGSSNGTVAPLGNDDDMPLTQLRDELMSFADLAALPPPRMINEYIAYDSLAWIGGNPGAYKSFLAVQWACEVAATGAQVIYVIAEGVRRFSVRFEAWAEANGVPVPDGIHFLPRSVQVNTRDWDQLRDIAKDIEPALIVLDTQARMSVGLSENDARDMGQYVNAVDRLRVASGACVCSVHHSPKAYASLRGSGALIGAADCIVMANRPDLERNTISLTNYKQKDIEQLDERWLRATPHAQSITLTECERPDWWAEAVKTSTRA